MASADELIEGLPVEVRELTIAARDLLRSVLPEGVETCEGGDLGFGVGPGYRGLVFVLTPKAHGVRLGIAGGATLPDPHHLMTGRGRVHRHLQLTKPSDLEQAGLRELLVNARDQKSVAT